MNFDENIFKQKNYNMKIYINFFMYAFQIFNDFSKKKILFLFNIFNHLDKIDFNYYLNNLKNLIFKYKLNKNIFYFVLDLISLIF